MSETLTRDAGDAGLVLNKRHMAFDLDGGIGARASIGLIVLATDQTIEYEFRRILDLAGVALYESRIFNDTNITPETLAAMGPRIAAATEVILPDVALDVIGFGCTSASMVLGPAAVRERIQEARPGVAWSNPMVAAFAAFAALGVRRVALLTPYVDEINNAMRAHIEDNGFAVTVMGSFNEGNDSRAARISPESVRAAALELGRSDHVDAVFVSCTSLRLVDVVTDLEADLGKPVTSSNHALAWHCLRLAGIADALPQYGTLYDKDIVPTA